METLIPQMHVMPAHLALPGAEKRAWNCSLGAVSYCSNIIEGIDISCAKE